MLKNYLKIALRNLTRNKMFSFLNILGLTAGTACCLYILVYVKDQFGFDTHHQNAENIYRLRTQLDFRKDQPVVNTCAVSPPIAPTIKQDFPEVEAYTRVLPFFNVKNNIIGVEGSTQTFSENKGYLVDSTFFKIFNYRFIEGAAEHSLDAPYTIVLSSAIAKKLFGNQKAINKRIQFRNTTTPTTLTVTGVFDETFGKSHLRPNFLVSLNSGGLGEFARNSTEWAGNNFLYGYLKLKSNTNTENLEAKFPALLKQYGAKRLAELGMKKQLFLQPITDINLYSKGIDGQLDKVSDISFLNMLLIIAAFIQLIACINFVNLTTARSVRRAKEVGVRKVVGAVRSSLIGQFLGESMLIALIAIFLALPIVQLLLPFLNSITDSAVSIDITKNYDIILITVLIALITGLLSGIYPALYLSNFKPVSVLKGVFKLNPTSILLRKGLVIFQFSIAIILIIGVLIISEQLSFMQTKDLGFNQKQKIVLSLPNDQSQIQFYALKNELLKQKEIKNVGGTTYYPSVKILEDMLVFKLGGSASDGVLIKNNGTESDFFKTMGVEIIAGRNFTPSDTTNQVIVNEKALKELKIDISKAIGTQLFPASQADTRSFIIIGVHKNYNNNSLKTDVDPMLSYLDIYPDYAVLDVQTNDYASFFANTEKIWKKIIPSAPFEYTFLDEEIQKQYAQEETLKKVVNTFTVIAILICCLGLFGLAMFTAEQRTKEIGVRKVLGASVFSITTLLSKEFLKPVLVAFLIASPIAYLAMNNWLQGFVYHINIGWKNFAVAGSCTLLITLFTVSYQAIRAALMNPVKSLRTE
jgi:putative ABC transport system permease protein